MVGIISPFNFPAMVPCWFFPIAVAAGNTVVLKPSEKDPSAANWLAALLAEAGLPAGVFNVVHGDKEAVDALLDAPRRRRRLLRRVHPDRPLRLRAGHRHGKRVQALGGAKNHMVVLPDADLDLAADAAVNAGFGSAGERCMAISVVVAVDRSAERWSTGSLSASPGWLWATAAGPATWGPGHRRAPGQGRLVPRPGGGCRGPLVVDGRDVVVDGEPGGFWLGPTLFDQVTADMSLYTDEIFGPVLSVVRAPTYDAALELVNANRYGNGTAIFTNDGGAARRFQNEVEVGMVGVDVPVPVPMAYYSFGGWKSSSAGTPMPTGPRACTSSPGARLCQPWLEPEHGGINLGLPETR